MINCTSAFTHHFGKKLPTIVRNDIQRKIAARQLRGGATRENLDLFTDEAVKGALKLAPFIEDKFSFADMRNNTGNERLNHHILMRDDGVRQLAYEIANECREVLNTTPESNTDSFLDVLIRVYKSMSAKLQTVHIRPPFKGNQLPKAPEKAQHILMVACKKMLSDTWLERQLLFLRTQYIEYAQITLERVGNKAHQQPNISHISFHNWMNKQREAQRFIENTLVLDEDSGEHFTLAEVIARTTANPENRRIEMMVRSRGFQELAHDLDYTCLFLTWTLPSQYHRNSDKWKGASVKEGHNNLMQQWAHARALLAKADIPYFGFRVAEPHKDATSHAHYFLFCHEDDKESLLAILRDVAISEDREELGDNITPRFKVKESDPAKGDATAYIAKYISKNINGKHLPENESEEKAYRARAWASTHRIRQFQQFGGEPVGLWRHLRRATAEQTQFDPELDTLRLAADTSKWSLFCTLANNATLAYEPRNNEYGETINRPIGFRWFVEGVGILINTCEKTYRLVKKSQLTGLLEGRRPVPWSTENNCNSPLIEALTTLTGWSANGVQCLIAPLMAGRKVPIDNDQRILLRNGRIVTYANGER